MKKYLMAAALVLVLGATALTSAQAQGSGKAFGVQGKVAPLVAGTVAPGGPGVEILDSSSMPAVLAERAEIFFKYMAANRQPPAGINFAALRVEGRTELLDLFAKAEKTAANRRVFLQGIQGFNLDKIDFAGQDFAGLGFGKADALKKFAGDYNSFIISGRFDPGFTGYGDDRIFFTAAEKNFLAAGANPGPQEWVNCNPGCRRYCFKYIEIPVPNAQPPMTQTVCSESGCNCKGQIGHGADGKD
jgi:hypothetical protein